MPHNDLSLTDPSLDVWHSGHSVTGTIHLWVGTLCILTAGILCRSPFVMKYSEHFTSSPTSSRPGRDRSGTDRQSSDSTCPSADTPLPRVKVLSSEMDPAEIRFIKWTGLFTSKMLILVLLSKPQTLFRPGSAFDKGAMKFHLRHPNWFPNCQSKNWCCLQVTAWEGVRDATKHADMCIQGPYLTPTQPGIEHIRAAFYQLFPPD
jgi:hypothetical protein